MLLWCQAYLFVGQVALPEIDGALEPIIFAGRDSATGKSHSLPERIDLLCDRAINWAKCVQPDPGSQGLKSMAVFAHSLP